MTLYVNKFHIWLTNGLEGTVYAQEHKTMTYLASMSYSTAVVSNRWTGLLDWILKKDVRLACKTACVVKTYASQGHTDVAVPRK